MRKTMKAVAAALAMLASSIGGAADFVAGHVVLWDGPTGDVREYDSTGAFLRSLRPQGYGFGGPLSLRFGPDRQLYGLAVVDTPTETSVPAIVQWDGSGAMAGLYRTPGTAPMEGFEIAANGNFYLVEPGNGSSDPRGVKVREWTRDFRQQWDFTVIDSQRGNQGDEEAVRFGNRLYVTSAGQIAFYDIASRSQVLPDGSFPTGMDNNRIAVSATGIVAVNDQWAEIVAGGRAPHTFVQTYDANGGLVGAGELPPGWALRGGLAFDAGGVLHVVADTEAGVRVATFAASGGFLGAWVPEGMNGSAGIAIAPVPEPQAWALFVVGAALIVWRLNSRPARGVPI